MPSGERPTLLLSRGDMARLLAIDDAVATVREVFRAHGLGQVAMPPKISLDMRPFGLSGWHNAMPAYVAPLSAAGIKWAGGYADNPRSHGLPYVMATIILQDPSTGYPLAIMDGVHVTAIRTGAVAAVCAQLYGRAVPGRVAFIGAGEQARTALEALMRVRPPTGVAVVDVARNRAADFAQRAHHRYGVEAIATPDIERAVTESEVIITATGADEPLVRASWIGPGTTSISLGSFQEFEDEAILGADKIAVDSWEQCAHRGELKRLAESGRLSRENVFAEVGDTAAGTRPGRESDDERIVVVPIGLGSHDVALARLAWERCDRGSSASFDFQVADDPSPTGATTSAAR